MLVDPVVVGGVVFTTVTLGVVLVGRQLTENASRERVKTLRRLRELGGATDPEPAGEKAEAGRVRTAVSRIGSTIGMWNGKGAARLQTTLALAGYKHTSAVLYFRGIRLVAIVALFLTTAAAVALSGVTWVKALAWGTAGGAVGFLGPSLVLSAQVRSRQRLLRHALPDALDIMVLCVEGGASLNAAVSWVTEEIGPVHPELGAEMEIVQREMQLGLSAGEAFRGFAERCGITEARDLAATLLQSEKYGASVAKTLRLYADSARQERQLWAEEMAHKAAVKIMFPMLLCIFPAMFIVLLGPPAFQMAKLFSR